MNKLIIIIIFLISNFGIMRNVGAKIGILPENKKVVVANEMETQETEGKSIAKEEKMAEGNKRENTKKNENESRIENSSKAINNQKENNINKQPQTDNNQKNTETQNQKTTNTEQKIENNNLQQIDNSQKNEENSNQTTSETNTTAKKYCINGGTEHIAGDGKNEHGYYNSWNEAFSAFEKYTQDWDSCQYKINECPCGLYYFWAIEN